MLVLDVYPKYIGRSLQGVLRMMVMESKRPCKPGEGFCTPSNKCVNQPGARRSPTPNDIAAARVNLNNPLELYPVDNLPKSVPISSGPCDV